MRKKIILLVLCLGLFYGLGGLWAEDKKTEETPPPKINKIVFYKHGMGYFERQGKVKDDASITMGFKTEQVKDLLTSLFVLDLNGGKITAVGYDSKDPIDKQLENILIRVPEGAALTQFLAQLKGAKVEVKLGDTAIRGSILGIEPVSQKQDSIVLTAFKFVLLSESGEIQPFNLFEISSIKLLDDPIQKDLKRILDIYLNSKYTDRKQIKLTCTGKGERNIMMGYLIEMPIWKTSYRIIFDENQKSFLQGWAIVENPTDEDWENVQMSFMSGNPISFNMDLYTSYYPVRPLIDLRKIIPLTSALIDVNELANNEVLMYYPGQQNEIDVGGGGGGEGRYGARFGGSHSLRKAAGAASPGSPMPNLALTKPLSELLTGSISSIAQGVQVGELFAYESKSPVSIARRKAAMVPIITENVKGEKILYYRSAISPRLMNAFYLNNSTKLTLEPGPVTLFEGSTSVGEGLLRQSLQSGMKDVIPYAIETGCAIEILNEQKGKSIHKYQFENGIMTLINYTTNETVYKLTNRTTRNQIVYLDQPRVLNYKLVEPSKPEEEVNEYYRFKIDLPAGANKEFKVMEQGENYNRIYLNTTSLDHIKYYIEQPYFTAKSKEFLNQLKSIFSEMFNQQRIYDESNVEYARLNEDQKRFRENMQVLSTENPKERELRESYVEKISKMEDKMVEIKTGMLTAQDTKHKLQAELNKKIQEYKE
jgi:hypothetical protein